jgi:hypothetical protein
MLGDLPNLPIHLKLKNYRKWESPRRPFPQRLP